MSILTALPEEKTAVEPCHSAGHAAPRAQTPVFADPRACPGAPSGARAGGTAPLSVAVAGGGAAGLMAAISAAENGAKVTVFDKNERAGRKLGLTGKGRCNLTSACAVPALLENLLRGGRFLYPAAGFFPPAALMEYFEKILHVPLKTERGGRVFPTSDRAGDIVCALVRRMRRLGCEYRQDRVVSVQTDPATGAVCGLVSERSAGRLLPFDRVIVATGGMSYPSTGSTGDGLRFARALGMETAPMLPSLVPLVIEEDFCREMQGLSLRNISLRLIDREKSGAKGLLFSSLGELLFTHFGISGPLALSASAHLPTEQDGSALAARRCLIELDLKPGLDESALDRRLQSDFLKYRNRDFANSLSDLLPAKMIPVILRLSGIPAGKKVHSILRAERGRLVRLLKCMPLTPTGTRPIEEAIVTRGGVSLREIDPRSMEAKRHPGLFFAGEVLDMDAYTGGYNLQIAFSTGRLAGVKASQASPAAHAARAMVHQ